MCLSILREGLEHDQLVPRSILTLDSLLIRHFGRAFVHDYIKIVGRPTVHISPDVWKIINALQEDLIRARRDDESPNYFASQLYQRSNSSGLSRSLVDIARSLFHMRCNRLGIQARDEEMHNAVLWHTYNGLERRGKLIDASGNPTGELSLGSQE